MKLVPLLPIWLIVIFAVGCLGVVVAALVRSGRSRSGSGGSGAGGGSSAGGGPGAGGGSGVGGGPGGSNAGSASGTRAGGSRLAGAWARRGTMGGVIVLMALGPSTPQIVEETLLTSVEVYFVVDRTTSLSAEDFGDGQPRFEGIRQDIVTLTRALPSSHYGIIAYAASANRDLPLTTDAFAVESWVESAHPEISVASAGSSLERPYEQLRRALRNSAQARPDNTRLVFFMSDGEANNDDGAGADYASLAQYINGGAVLGYGTTRGGQMRVYGGEYPPDPEADFVQDPSTGKPAVSKLDPSSLQQLAEQLGLEYVERSEPADVSDLVAGVDSRAVAAQGSRPATIDHAVIWPLGIALALLAAWEAWSLASRGFTSRQRLAARRRRREQAAADAANQPIIPAEWTGAGR